jgi:hypothetical protein
MTRFPVSLKQNSSEAFTSLTGDYAASTGERYGPAARRRRARDSLARTLTKSRKFRKYWVGGDDHPESIMPPGWAAHAF